MVLVRGTRWTRLVSTRESMLLVVGTNGLGLFAWRWRIEHDTSFCRTRYPVRKPGEHPSQPR